MAPGPKPRPDLTVVQLDGETVIFDDRNGTLHHLNETATIVFSLLDGEATLDELAADIAHATQAPAEEIRKQIDHLLRTFHDSGLLVGSTIVDSPN